MRSAATARSWPMKPRAMFTAVVLAALLTLPQLAGAVVVHTFDCKNCHIPTLSVADLGGGNVCLTCHSGELNTLLNDGTTGSTNSAFGALDSSNAMGNNASVVAGRGQTSHNWSGPDTQTAAGATAPSRITHPEFYSRQGASTGRVTCSRCHNPHGDDTNPQLLTKGVGSAETMCTACHVPWVKGAGMTNVTHPVDIDYATAAAAHPGKYVAVGSLPTNDGNINTDTPISLTGGKVVCGSCHQVHFADSDPTTPDIPSNWDNLSFSGGNGKALRSYGRVATDATGVKSSALCTTCHIYEKHGGTHATLGCLDCHGGHSPAGNYNMLRPVVTALGWVPKDGAAGDSDPLAYTTTTAEWKNASGTGYCQGCHNIPATVTQHNVASATSADCVGCHSHQTGSFTKTCNGCHGYAPTTNTAGGTTGYAVTTTAPIYNYSTSGKFKDESQTPHKRHTNGGTDYSFACNQCHYTVVDVETAPHKDGNFQNVTFSGSGTIAWTDTSTPAYTATGNGSCSTTYCHSNGGPRSNGAKKYSATAPVWATGAGDIATCDVCHGNTAATMAPAQRDNSATHIAHLNKNYACNVCHSQTATGNTALVAAGGDHVDGQADVFFDNAFDLNGAAAGGALGAGSYGNTDGTCTTYCHSNGKGAVKQAPDWDDATTGDCGDCHAVAAGTGLLDAHDKHLNAGIGCDTCHGANASTGTHAAHVNRVIDKPAMAVCNACHGATAGQTTGNDREPIWTSVASVDCGTCHVGVLAVINARTAPAKNSFYVSGGGHGDPTLPAGSPNCLGCHTLTADHIDGVTDSNMLTGGATANDAFCKSCHAINSHYANTRTAGGTSNDALACATCHEPHGDGMGTNTDVMLLGTIASRTVNNFTDKAARASYWEADNTGVCQVCHDPTEVSYFNRTANGVTADASHNPGSVCTQCHRHESTPESFAAGCTDCHGNTAAGNYWPDSTAQHGTAWPNRLGSHDIHITKIAGVGATMAQKNATCGYCHPSGGHSGDQAASPADLMNGTTSKFKNILGATNVQTSSVTQSGGNVSCSNVDCHYTTATVAADWYTAGDQASANCNYCHVYTGTYTLGTLPDAHDKHMGETAANGRNMDCTQCHPSTIDAAHQNGVIDFSTAAAPLETTLSIDAATTAGTKLGPKYNAAGAVAAEFSTCANLECHGNFTGGKPANAPNWFNTDARIAGLNNGDGACGTCHGSDSAATPTTNKHAVHLGSNTYVPGNCDDCHTKAVTTHVFGTVDLGGNATVASAPTCTNACHTLDGLDNNVGAAADNPSWTSANKLGCEDCHVSGKTWAGAGGALLTRGLPPATGKHADHGGGYIAAGCVDCHSTNTVTHSLLNNIVEVDGNKVSAYAAGNCTNTCHTLNGVDNAAGGGNDATWTAANLLGCVDCHTNAKAGLKANLAPTSGLHTAATAMAHDVQFLATAIEAAPGTATCTSCHSTAVTSQHINTVGPTAFGAGGITYTWNANINSYSAAGCAAKCHLDAVANSGNGKWSRKWLGVVDAKPLATDNPGAAVCDNCHGDGINKTDGTTVDNAWNAGMAPGHQDSPDADTDIEMLSQHANCKTCHGYGSDQYEEAWGGGSPTPFGHGDGKINMNGPDAAHGTAAGAQYDETNFGCLSACHTGSLTDSGASNYNHTMSDSNWTIAYGDFPSSCFSCHGNGTNSYWPDGGATPDRAGRHQKHMEIVAAKLGVTLPGDDAQQRAICEYCHPAPAGTINHLNSVGNVTSMKKLWDGSADNGAWDAAGDTNKGTCATVDCHNNMTTPAGYSWYGASTSVCSMCHINAPAEQTHAAHLSGSIYGLDNSCAYCHDAATSWTGNTKPASNHINGTFNVSGSVTLAYTGTYPTVKGSCGTNACHNNGRNGAPASGVYTWGTTTNSQCSFCHLNNAQGHQPHFVADGVMISAGGMACSKCHPYNGSTSNVDHMNASINVLGTMGYNGTNLGVTQAASPGTCTTNICHQDGNGTAKVTPLWNRTPSAADNCSICHFDAAPAATAAHDAHIGTAGATSYTAAAANSSTAGEYRFTCAKCHGNTLANHLSSASWAAPTINVAATVNYVAGTDSCVNNACHNNGKGAGVGNDAIRTAYWAATNWGASDDSDPCNNCHGNSPTTNAHRAHAVGIHAEDIYSGATGKLSTATATKSHGDATNSSTISCNVCHSGTVTSARNKFGTECNSCHSGAAEVIMAVADKSKHLDDGTATAEVSFVDMTAFKSKAQLRDNLADANDGTTILSAVWNRITGYKAAASHDKGQAAFATPNFAGGNCSNVACHNNQPAIWNSAGNINPATYAPNCMGCHTSLPK
ncbi:MAG: CxxxxCH/CxxCH domain-containing protein [Desulfuromonas sp.]|nr:CxxxxCH/CxxCH domain-containing protein [Desulfuromonas sp.]